MKKLYLLGCIAFLILLGLGLLTLNQLLLGLLWGAGWPLFFYLR